MRCGDLCAIAIISVIATLIEKCRWKPRKKTLLFNLCICVIERYMYWTKGNLSTNNISIVSMLNLDCWAIFFLFTFHVKFCSKYHGNLNYLQSRSLSTLETSKKKKYLIMFNKKGILCISNLTEAISFWPYIFRKHAIKKLLKFDNFQIAVSRKKNSNIF